MTAPTPTPVLRVPLLRPLTKSEDKLVALLASGKTYGQCAEPMGIGYPGVVFHARNAAAKIPGDLKPVQAKIVAWYRGATRDILDGRMG